MAATTHPEFNANTEAFQVAEAFPQAIRGKTVLVTGVNRNGIGFTTSQAFVNAIQLLDTTIILIAEQASQSPTHLIITGRSPVKIQDSINALKEKWPEVTYHGLQVDLSIQKSVRDAAAKVMGWSDVPTIDIIVNSAGIMSGEKERVLSEDGVEMHFATNHIGHWLFTCLIMPKLIKAAEKNPAGATRIVNVTSASPQVSGIRWSDMNFEKKNKDLPIEEQPEYEWFRLWGYTSLKEMTYTPLDGYNRSKVANVLSGIAANKRLFGQHGILALAVHPGVIATELGRTLPEETLQEVGQMLEQGLFTFKTLGAGSSTSMVAALDPKLAQGVGETRNGSENWGSYLDDCQISGQGHSLAVSSNEAEKLWQISERLVGQSFAW
ncbi:hypothetical protein NUU61_009116 [Penicillium alfredii]|uniref:NAD(P)-binding protein n=1 Tax=Penicillium alfredii TaxID=1506179 RepID=A0A9W9EMF1_9EURO|nr:uncharacterized protein NUU61_009116 [Penicillium alfredii]KAJ5084537.1 hypothetical protein NUU61_009116 [Penicillium alfredii]